MIRERKHRLPKDAYKGEVSVAFTLCLDKDSVAAGFSLREREVLDVFTNILAQATTAQNCIVPVYCFLPDHQHLIISGLRQKADLWNALVSYKQRTGFWLSLNMPKMKWQKNFYDHIIRGDRDIAAQVRYILDNPVRKGLVSAWQEYPFKGAIGCKLEDILCGIM